MLRPSPHSVDAEQQLLGAILVDPEAYHKVADLVTAEEFFDPRHGQIFEAAGKLLAAGKNANAITISKLPGQDFPYLKELMTISLGTFAARDFAQLIHDMHVRRQLIELGERLVQKASDKSDVSPAELIEEVDIGLAALGVGGEQVDHHTNLTNASAEALEAIAAAYKRDDAMAGLPTGFIDLDKKLGGLAPSDLIILAARPSMGKSALAASIAYRAATAYARNEGGCPVGFFTLEMSANQLAMRLIAEASGIPSFKLRRGAFEPSDYEHIIDVVADGFQNPFLQIDQTGRLNIDQLCARARRMHRQKNIGLIVVDYLQLLSGAKRSRDNRHVEVGEITGGLKALAKDLNIPVLALSQLSREVEKRDDKRPQLSDLRESGSVEQDADVVVFLYREEYYLNQHQPKENAPGRATWEGEMRDAKGKAELIIAKQRHGPIGSVDVMFDASLTKFSNLSKQHELGEAA